MSKSARLYKENLEDQKILFLYGVPSEVKREIQKEDKRLFSLRGYEVVFHRYNFLHLTGVKINSVETASAIHFYEKCLGNRLTENDFSFASDGSTGQKLDILENMMLIKKNVSMIGDFTHRGAKVVYGESSGKYLWLHWLCKRPEYWLECAQHFIEKGYQRCNCISKAKSICCYFKGIYGRKILCD